MAFKQNLAQKLYNMYSNKLLSNQTLRSCLISSSSSSPSSVQSIIPSNPEKVAHDPGENSIFRRFLQRRPLYLSTTKPPLPQLLRPGGEKLLETLKEMDIARNRVRLGMDEIQFTVADAKKILRVSQMETVKSELRNNRKKHVSYDEFIQICVNGCGNNRDQGVDLANVLDNSGSVIVLGNVVFLKPEQVVKAINGLLMDKEEEEDLPMKELEGMERWKSEIDNKAEKMVRRELWGGLGYLVVQTAAFMRLTFWELSWDVMEPICFYVTSMYFMLGYAYFLRTSREPSFEAVFKSRFHSKQMKLMKMEGFDVKRYNELKRRMEGCSFEQVYDGTIN